MPLSVTVVSAEEEVWSGEASLVIAKTVEGQIGFMAGHEPVLAILADGQVRITPESGDVVVAEAHEGFLSVEDDVVMVVAGHAKLAS